jgi:membrane dipeptidase
MHIEGLNVLDDEPWPRLERWHALGWRSLGIVWNINNPLGGGTTDPTRGLTDLGREVLVWAESKRMLIDFAHMNPLVFADALAATKSPIFISHGNTNQHCPSPRNYSDQQLRAVADRGGVIGPFFSKDFLVPEGQPATLEDVAAHFLHLRNLVGSDHIALGTDFGGILYGFADSLSSLQDLPNLWQALREVGFSDAELEGIAWKNAARFFESVLP